MNRQFKYLILLLLILMSNCIFAQNKRKINPDNPPEPGVEMKYKVTVSITPSTAGYVSGEGQFSSGEETFINTSGNAYYTFKHWNLNGKKYTTDQSFYYTVTDQDADFEAIYDYKYRPDNPAEPGEHIYKKVYAVAEPSNACSFNWSSGDKFEVGSTQYFYVYANQGYSFTGWYENDVLLSTSQGFEYTIKDADATLTAKFKFDPNSPQDPYVVGEGEYSALNYIEYKGENGFAFSYYFDTGYIPQSNTEVELKCYSYPTNNAGFQSAGYWRAICSGRDDANTGLSVYLNSAGNQWGYYVGGYVNGYVGTHKFNTPYIIKANLSGITINDETYETSQESYYGTGQSMTLFCGQQDYTYFGRIYYFKVYEDGQLIHDFEPTMRNEDLKIGFLDLVDGNFITASNDDGFDYGGIIGTISGDVNRDTDVNVGDIIRLSKIVRNGQYNSQESDVNSDDAVDDNDIEALKQKILTK